MDSKGILIAAVALSVLALGVVIAYNQSPREYSEPTGNPPAVNFQGPTGAPSVNGPTSNPPGY